MVIVSWHVQSYDYQAQPPRDGVRNWHRATAARAALATSLSFVATLMPTGVPTAAAAGPRYYLRLRGVEIAAGAIVGGEPSATAPAKPAEAPGSAPADGGSVAAELAGRRSPSEAVVAMASENLTAELRKRPEVVLELDGVARRRAAGSHQGRVAATRAAGL